MRQFLITLPVQIRITKSSEKDPQTQTPFQLIQYINFIALFIFSLSTTFPRVQFNETINEFIVDVII